VVRRFISVLCLLLSGVRVSAADPLPPLPIRSVNLALAAASAATSASLATAPDGTVWLTWLEPATDGTTTLRGATLDAAATTWNTPRTIARGRDWLVNGADTPSLAIEPGGRLTAGWSVMPVSPAATAPGHHHHEAISSAVISQSVDRGVTWSPPTPLSRESVTNEFVSLQPLAAGRVLAAWLDGRGKHGVRDVQQLYARLVAPAGSDQLVDASVCDCCQTTLTRFPDGSALLAYRGRAAGEIRDIHVARFQDGRWSPGRVLYPDGWKIAGCPVNGPQLASAGGRAAIAWFTAANGEARVLVSASPDAGARFLMPLRVDLGHPMGRVDTVMLADGSSFVTWLEGAGDRPGLWLRRITPNFELGQAVRLAALAHPGSSGFPRLTLVKDYDATPAQLAVVWSEAGAPSGLQTRLITLPDRSTLAGRKPCVPCDEDDASAVRGYPVKGRIVQVQADRATLLLQHDEIPGVMRAMTMEFHADPDVLAAAKPGRELLARIERRGQPWWIFGVKWLGPS
jgi:hypothetical protein